MMYLPVLSITIYEYVLTWLVDIFVQGIIFYYTPVYTQCHHVQVRIMWKIFDGTSIVWLAHPNIY